MYLIGGLLISQAIYLLMGFGPVLYPRPLVFISLACGIGLVLIRFYYRKRNSSYSLRLTTTYMIVVCFYSKKKPVGSNPIGLLVTCELLEKNCKRWMNPRARHKPHFFSCV